MISFLQRFFVDFMPSKWGRWILKKGARGRLFNALRMVRRERKMKFRDNLSIIAMFRNEAPYLAEWIEYHLLVGIDRFYLFDNESTDNSKEVLQPYIDRGIVVYEFVTDEMLESKRAQYGEKSEKSGIAHWMGTEKCRLHTKWEIFIDPDEFIVPKQDKNLTEFLYRFGDKVTQIILGWNIYGSNGHIKKPAGLVIENYTMRGVGRNGMDDRGNFKAIVNPRAILMDFNHYHLALGTTVDETGGFSKIWLEKERLFPTDICCINHYIVRSREECTKKIDNNKKIHFWRYNDAGEYFKKYDCNDVQDLSIQRFAKKLSRIIYRNR